MFGDEATHLGSEAQSLVSDLTAGVLGCFAVTFKLLCCRWSRSPGRRSTSVDIAEYHAPAAAPLAQSMAGSTPERSSPSSTSAHGGRQHRDDQPLLKAGQGSSEHLPQAGWRTGPQGQEMQGLGALKQKEGLELGVEDEDCCPTCLESFTPEVRGVLLPPAEDPAIESRCHHRFHLQCILVWYERRQTCPVCDRKMDMEEIEAGLA